MKDNDYKKNKYFFRFPVMFRDVDSYLPWYDEYSDYNTNAKSYYDYLARWNKAMAVYYEFINRLLRRNLEVEDTDSISFSKIGDWIDNGECEPDNFDDIIKLLARVRISTQTETREMENLKTKNFNISNGTKVKNDGVWSPDYLPILKAIDSEIGDLWEENNNLKDALQKIVDNLFKSGAITNNNIFEFEFKNGRDIATGNINLFGGVSDGNSFIRTTDGEEENDITAGI